MKTIRTTKTNFLRTGYGENDILEQKFVESEVLYSDDDKVLKESHFNTEGEVESLVENEYDAQGRVASSSQFDEGEELSQKNVFEYDEDGKVLKKGCFYGEGSPEYATRYVYEDGKLVREDSYNEDEFDFTEKSYEYDENGRLKCQTDYDEDGKVMYRYTRDYDENDRLAKMLYEEVMANDSRTYLFSYDENGRKIKDLTYNFNDKLIAKSYYVYDEEGRLIEQEDEDLDNYRKTVFTFEGSNCTKVEQFDKDGQKLNWTEYAFNENGDPVLIKSFVPDEVRPEVFRTSTIIEQEYE